MPPSAQRAVHRFQIHSKSHSALPAPPRWSTDSAVNNRFPVIVGPTAGGKSSLAVELCLRLNSLGSGPAEVVSADSMQVYRGMDIGTAKPTIGERAGVVHHLIDVAEPTEAFTVDRWLKLADAAIAEIRARGGVPVVVGGTNLYVKALLEGLFEGPPEDAALRGELTAMDPRARRAELERVDPAAAARIHFNDVRRTVRALEVYRRSGVPISVQQAQWEDRGGTPRADAVIIGLDWPAEAVNRRINTRVKEMFERGFVDEVRGLLDAGRLGPQAREALGYKQIAVALAAGGRPDQVAESLERTKIETRRFAKNQRTWLKRFRALPGSVWINAGETAPERWLDEIAGAGLFG